MLIDFLGPDTQHTHSHAVATTGTAKASNYQFMQNLQGYWVYGSGCTRSSRTFEDAADADGNALGGDDIMWAPVGINVLF